MQINEINYTELPIQDLVEVRNNATREINKREADRLEYLRQQQEKKDALQQYGYALIRYTEEELGYKIVVKCRKTIYTTARSILMAYLRETGLTFNRIGYLFLLDHASVMYAIDKHNDMLKVEDSYHMEQYSKLTEIIRQFNECQEYKNVG